MTDRRRFLKASVLGASASILAWGGKLAAGPIDRSGKLAADPTPRTPTTAVARVVSTWDFGIAANQAAWTILGKGGHALDAVEFGVQVPESDLKNHSVGRAGYPDRDGHVSLDASIMDADGNCGAVAALEHIAHPIAVARRVMARTVARLDRGSHRDLPIVVAEPSCAAALKRDVPELLGTDAARRVAARVHTLTGALTDLSTSDWQPDVPDSVVLQTHCHEYATFGGPRDLLRRLGVRKVTEAEGCCGLAGNFGFEEGHFDVSQACAERVLLPALRQGEGDAVLADGFSCRTQIEQLDSGGRRAIHLAELLARGLDDRVATRAP